MIHKAEFVVVSQLFKPIGTLVKQTGVMEGVATIAPRNSADFEGETSIPLMPCRDAVQEGLDGVRGGLVVPTSLNQHPNK